MNECRFPSLRLDGRTLIVGLGETGLAAARWCARHGAALRILDTRAEPPGLAVLREELGERADYRVGLGDWSQDALLDEVHTLVLSPGLAPGEAPVSTLLAMARERGIEVVGEMELFARALRDLRGEGYAPGVVAVTGTNGKTTVTALTRRMIERGGRKAVAAGNISPAALDALARALDEQALPDAWVLELSSFQLETTHSLEADAAVVLNLTQDHLDWHGDMAAYGAAKQRLFSTSRLAVNNRDDARVAAMVPDATARNVVSFGTGAPMLAGDLGLLDEGEVTWLAAAQSSDFETPAAEPKGRRRRQPQAQPRAEGSVTRLMPVEAMRLQGRHNAMNALAALALARALGLGWPGLLLALQDYEGEPHRVEFVRNVAGVDFIDDSKGTNVGATVAALEGLGRSLVLIAGGQGKGQDFSPLCAPVSRHARAVVLIGVDAPRLAETLADCGVPLLPVATLDEAVAQALAQAREGDAVLLSPACASLDMFKNYVQRGLAFAEAVRELALSRGEVA